MAVRIAANIRAEMVGGLAVGNRSVVCQNGLFHRHDIFNNGHPLDDPTTLLLFQMSTISIVTKLLHYALQPLGQLSVSCQLLAGLLLGPSCLGRISYFGSGILFPEWGIASIETFTSFGVMFFVFGLGVKMDPVMMLHPDRKSAVIGTLMLVPSLVLTILFSIYLTTQIPMETTFSNSLAYIAGTQALTGFPIVSSLVTELRLLNTDLGRLAISSSMFCDAVNIFLTTIGSALSEADRGTPGSAFLTFLSAVALLLSLVFLVRPILLWMINKTPPGKPMAEIYLMFVYVIVLLTGFISESIGQHYVLGPLFLGLLVPDGPPLGTAIETKVETLVSGLLYPTFVSINGLQTDTSTIELQYFWIVGAVVLVAYLVKFVAVLSGSLYVELPFRESIVLALMVNVKGIIEIVLFNMYRNSELLTDEAFSLCIISVMLVTGLTSPVIKILYNPSRQYISAKRCTIQHSRHDAEFRMLVCVHSEENVPSLINLLEVSHATNESSILVVVMALVELVGRTTPVLVRNRDRTLNASVSMAAQITNAFHNYGRGHKGLVTVETFTAISDFLTMHNDVCQVALDEGAHLIVVPFHKQWSVAGRVESVNPLVRTMNLNVLENAPCSVGILIDRGAVCNSLKVLNANSAYHVAVLFIGGPDDVESLAYGTRMMKHENVILTIVRFLLFGDEKTKDRKVDSELIYEYRHEHMSNERFVYVEEVVRDGVGLAAFLKGVVDSFNLIIVGRYHRPSPIFEGLHQWRECPEIGIVPDMLASSDFEGTATVLVMQQQRIAGNFGNQPVPGLPAFKIQPDEPLKGSWPIEIDHKYGRNPKDFS